MKKSAKNILVLVCICAVVSVLLALTNSITDPIIKANEQKNANAALLEVLPDGGSFELIDISSYTLPATVSEVYRAENGGYVVKLNTTGYNSGMVLMCGVTADGSVSGTPGTGKTLSAFSETDGVVSATFSDISITKSQVSDFPTIPTISDSYDGTSSNGMSGKAVKSAIDALDVTTSGAATNKTVTALTQTDGKISATFSNISITKSQVSDFPTIPTVNDATLTIQQNGTSKGTFTANASSNVTANIITDIWSSTSTVDSSGNVVFDNLDNSYGYELYAEDVLVGISSMTKGTGTQSGIKLTYATDAPNGTVCKLRILR